MKARGRQRVPGRRNATTMVLGAAVVLSSALSWQCTSDSSAKAGAGAPASPFYGEMKPLFSVKELMARMIDPISDDVFDAVRWDTTSTGTTYVRPQSDEDWEKVRVGAVTLAEGIELLKVRRPWAPAGDVNDSVGPNAPELSPTQIQALVNDNPAAWNAMIEQLRSVALEVIEVTKKRDPDALFAASGALDRACENCHLVYWYPGDRKIVETEAAQGRVSRVPATRK